MTTPEVALMLGAAAVLLMPLAANEQAPTQIHVVLNFLAELRERAWYPAKRTLRRVRARAYRAFHRESSVFARTPS